MQLIVEIKNKEILDKIIWLLKILKEEGVEIKEVKETSQEEIEFSDEYIEKNWKEILMNTHSADLDDDEELYEAYGEFYEEKYSD